MMEDSTMTKTYRVDVFHVSERRKLRMTIAACSSMDALRKANKMLNRNPSTPVSKAEYVAYGVAA